MGEIVPILLTIAKFFILIMLATMIFALFSTIFLLIRYERSYIQDIMIHHINDYSKFQLHEYIAEYEKRVGDINEYDRMKYHACKRMLKEKYGEKV